MNDYITTRYNDILKKLDVIELFAVRISIIMICLAAFASILSPGFVAYADGPDDDIDGAAMTFVGVINDLGKLAIKICYALMFIVFAVGSVKSGLGAQAAQAFGATGRVSMELLNLIGGTIIFAVGLMTLPIVNSVIDSISTKLEIDANVGTINNPVFK